jgi:hypothetical protein
MLQRRQIVMAMFAGCGLAIISGCNTSEASPIRNEAGSPVVVELFQSQGCSSCPPANADLNAIADRGEVLALSFAVTYWDRLGWKDTFGSPRFTARQQDYANAGRGEVATPEFIINGAYAVVGSNRPALEAAIARASPPRSGPVHRGRRCWRSCDGLAGPIRSANPKCPDPRRREWRPNAATPQYRARVGEAR